MNVGSLNHHGLMVRVATRYEASSKEDIWQDQTSLGSAGQLPQSIGALLVELELVCSPGQAGLEGPSAVSGVGRQGIGHLWAAGGPCVRPARDLGVQQGQWAFVPGFFCQWTVCCQAKAWVLSSHF